MHGTQTLPMPMESAVVRNPYPEAVLTKAFRTLHNGNKKSKEVSNTFLVDKNKQLSMVWAHTYPGYIMTSTKIPVDGKTVSNCCRVVGASIVPTPNISYLPKQILLVSVLCTRTDNTMDCMRLFFPCRTSHANQTCDVKQTTPVPQQCPRGWMLIHQLNTKKGKKKVHTLFLFLTAPSRCSTMVAHVLRGMLTLIRSVSKKK